MPVFGDSSFFIAGKGKSQAGVIPIGLSMAGSRMGAELWNVYPVILPYVFIPFGMCPPKGWLFTEKQQSSFLIFDFSDIHYPLNDTM
jgi:hypothetical protein